MEPTAAILCVDDEPQVLTLLHRTLNGAFAPAIRVIASGSPGEALAQVEALATSGRDLIVLVTDERMPGMSGEELIARTRALSPATPAILISGFASTELLGRVMGHSGLFRYIAKPFQPAELIAAVRDAERAFFQQKEFRHLDSLMRQAAGSGAAPPEASRILQRQEALLELSLNSSQNFESRLFAILERTADVLEADRSCLLQYSNVSECFECTHLFDAKTGAHHSPRTILYAADHPSYAAAIGRGEIVIAKDVAHDPGALPSIAGLHQLRVTASIDAPVWQNGRLIGVLRGETFSGPRDWTQEEIYFSMLAAHMIGAAREAEQRHRAEVRLRQAEERYRAIFENAVVGIYQTSMDGRLISCNPAMARLLGFESPAAMKGAVSDIAGEIYADPSRRDELIARLRENQVVVDFESTLRRRDGTILFVSESARLVPDPAGGIAYMEGIIQDITPRVRAARDLKLAKEAAEHANRAKGAFLATVSHEIRTPLNGVIGLLDFLLENGLPTNLHAHARLAQESAHTLLATINDVLDFSKIESGRFELAESPVDLHRLVADIMALHAPGAAAKGIGLGATVDPAIPRRVLTDPLRVRQVLQNLIANGIKFTDAGDVSLRLRSRADGRDIIIEGAVEDTGIGIPAEAHDRIFREFEQADKTTSRRFGGTGLGLAICRSLIERLGGAIRVESEPDKGSRFLFHFRARPAPEADAARPPPRSPEPTRSLHILCVEDSPTNQAIARMQLAHMGHSVEIASNGQEAIARLSRANFDAILLDIRMPVMDGIGVARHIRDTGSPVIDHAAYVIAMTADAMEGDRERYLAEGMDDYISKPVAPEALRAALARAGAYADSRSQPPPAPPPAAGSQPETIAVEALWPIFAEEASALLREMEQAMANGDAARIARAAHTLKGSSGSFGCHRLHRLCDGIEKEAAAGHSDALHEWLRQARSELDHTLIEHPPISPPS